MPFAFKVIPRLLLCVAHRYQCMKRLWWGRGQQQNIFSYLKINISPLFGVRDGVLSRCLGVGGPRRNSVGL